MELEYEVVAPPDQQLANKQQPDTDLCYFAVLGKLDTQYGVIFSGKNCHQHCSPSLITKDRSVLQIIMYMHNQNFKSQ